MSKIIELYSENIKRLSAVHIIPENDFIVISGENGEGKSSVIDSIWLALAGADAMEENTVPIHNGKDDAVVVVKTEDYIITRTWTANDRSYLKVEANIEAESKPVYSSPQTLLNKLIGDLTFDPLEYLHYDSQKQINILIKLSDLKVNPLEFDQKVSDLKLLRRDVNRDFEKFKNLAKDLPEPELNLPDKEIDINDLIREKDLINAQIREHDRLKQKELEAVRMNERAVEDRLKHLAKIDDLKKTLEILERDTKIHDNLIKETFENVGRANKAVATHSVGDLNGVDRRILEAQSVNKKIQARDNRQKIENERDRLFEESEAFTGKIEEILQQKRAVLELAKYPIEGLGFDDNGPTFNDLPLKQASQAEKIKVCFAIAMALNPTFKVVMTKEADKLDKSNMILLSELAEKNGYQYWIEKVYEDQFPAIIIEDGAIKEVTKGGEKVGKKKKRV